MLSACHILCQTTRQKKCQNIYDILTFYNALRISIISFYSPVCLPVFDSL